VDAPLPGAGPRPEFRDRRKGLAVFGVLSFAVGAFATCFTALTPIVALAPAVAGEAAMPRADPRGLVIATLFYAGLAALFIALGFGSLRARRWVRPIMLVVSWIWLGCGVLGLATWLILLPTFPSAMRATRPAEAPIPDDIMTAVTLVASLLLLAMYVALPSLFIWFYHDRDVRLTLESADPLPRWTDRCPLPVLGLSLALLGAGAAALAPIPYGAVPAFGVILTGASAVIFCVALAAAALALSRAAYRMRIWAWWGSLALVLLVNAGSLAAFLRVDMAEVYERMHMPPEDIAMMREGGLLSGSAAILTTAALGTACLAYLVFVRKYFRERPRATP